MSITKIDKNFLTTELDESEVEWHEITEEGFSLHGIYYDAEDNIYRRLPKSVASSVSKRIEELNGYSSGGRIRFVTNSPFICIKAKLPNYGILRHQPLVGQYGFSLYVNNKFYGMYTPLGHQINPDMKTDVVYDGIQKLGQYQTDEGEFYNMNLFCPSYGGLREVFIGLKKGSIIKKHKPYTHQKPVVFYGSSITQGGVASRPGNEYISHISRTLDTDYINLGFAGNAKGEQVMAKHVSSIDASVFVIDYDYNAPNVKHLEDTHYAFYKTVRSQNPTTPIIFITRPNFGRFIEDEQRWKVVYASYLKAQEEGDKRVFFIDGKLLFGEDCRDACTVDGIHPNDLGFYRMFKVICPVVEKCINLK